MLRSSVFLALGLAVTACGTDSPGGSGTGGQTQSGGASGATSGGAAPTSGGAATGGASLSGGSGPTSGGSSSGGAASGGTGTGGTAAGGTTTGGGSATGGSAGLAGGGAGTGGSGGAATGGTAGGGAGGGAGGTGGSTSGWKCPAGITGKPTLTGLTPTRIASVPPPDAFNMNNGTYGNVEGPVWIGDALYVSEMGVGSYPAGNQVTKSRILKVTSDGNTSVFVADSGSNGLAVDANGNIVAAVHKDGSLTRFALPSGAPTPVATGYMDKRFNTPNDLAIRSDGNIYFTDPRFQAPDTLPQGETRVYRRDPSGTITPLTPLNGQFNNPNGITLSLNEDFLYVAASNGVRYPVMSDGSVGTGQAFPAANGGDGMVIDCAGNLYVANPNGSDVEVYSPEGMSIGKISVPSNEGIQVTNVAFGGSDHKTLYITGQQNKKGLFQVKLDLPGRPY